MKDKILTILIILTLLVVMVYVSFLAWNAYHLWRFRQCYDNNFKLSYCEFYRNY